MGLKSNDWCPYEKRAWRDTERRKPREGRGGLHWCLEAGESQGSPAAQRSWEEAGGVPP